MDDESQLADTVDDLERKLDIEKNRSAVLEACLREQVSYPNGYQLWRGICYKAFNTAKTFNEAAVTCRKDGGTLVMPRDAETNAFLISIRGDTSMFYIGLQDQREEGIFEWADGSALGEYNSWAQDSTYPGGTNGRRRVIRDFVRSYRGCIVGVTAVVATLIIVGLVVMVFIYKEVFYFVPY
ncbi:C-type lectin domain family 3 member A homolog [Branchiostoma floridae]|uniref:C-type lectin domain family 3 member A homolog n=1 Tax=Branchiostoma floridae TaxID=7739 RepID=A0A9J7LU64_BRAFL|nr:C-type lectin domain family 3 member A homolog [Branchiostoma floridae]